MHAACPSYSSFISTFSPMEDLLADLSASFSVSGENSSYSQHPRWADFKNEGRVAEKQRSRRQVQLDRQKRLGLLLYVLNLK